jgi:hypothetical protein
VKRENITGDMLRFKEAIRHVWNTYLVNVETPIPIEIWDSYDRIELELFKSIVLISRDALGVADVYRKKPISQILVRPRSNSVEVPVQFGKRNSENRNIAWQLSTNILATNFPNFHFLCFFDWNEYGQIDLPYVQVVDANDGQLCMIEQCFFEFEFDDKKDK